MLTTKQKATLKGLANSIQNRYLLGKDEIDANFLDVIDKALEAHELIKVGLLQTSSYEPKEVGKELAAQTGAELVQVIGRVIVLYRVSKKHPRNLLG